MTKAAIENYNGSPAIMIDGVPHPPMMMTMYMNDREYIRALGEAGIRLFFLMENTDWLQPVTSFMEDEYGEPYPILSGMEQFIQDATTLLEEIPDAYIFVRIGLHPPAEWVNDHMDQVVQYSDGSHMPVHLCSEVHKEHLPGAYSLSSQKWREDAGRVLMDFCERAEKLPFADRIVGYFLAAGGTSEWYYLNDLQYKNLYADFSPAFVQEYTKILKEKYGTVEALRKAWKDPNAEFEKPYIPDLKDREYVYIYKKIRNSMQHEEHKEYVNVGEELDINPQKEGNIGMFLNADAKPAVAEFYHAWHRGTANSIIYFAKLLKERNKDKLVGAFYGSYGATDHYNTSTAEAVLPILDCGYVDFLTAPGVYNNREPGGYVAQREMQDSIRLRNRIFITEEDSRTHLVEDFYRSLMEYYDIQDSVDILKRDYARNICEDTYAYWFDQAFRKRYYKHEEIYKLFKQQQEISDLAFSFDRTKKNEIALIYDQESLHYICEKVNQTMLDHYRTTDLGRIGAPVDYYFHDDMANDKMPDYKMYVMLNTFVLSEAERDAIHRKAAKNGATVVWLYAPGFIDTEKDRRMDNSYIEGLTGFKVGRMDNTMSTKFRLCSEHPAVRYGDKYRKYGFIDRDIESNIWIGSAERMVPIANPYFYLKEENDMEVLGRYCNDKRAAFGLKKYKGFTSVYCTAHILRSELLASLAEYSGCHLFVHGDDCVYANENFVTVHAKDSGKRKIYFKRPCNPYELYEKKYYGTNVTEIKVDMLLGETKMFCVADAVALDGIKGE